MPLPTLPLYDAMRWRRGANIAALCAVATLPWSTTGTTIAVIAWLILLIPTLRLEDVESEALQNRSLFGVLLFGLTVLSTLWSIGAMPDRITAATAMAKLAVLPLLIVQFRRDPDWGRYAIIAFLAASFALLVTSYLTFWLDYGRSDKNPPGVFVKDWISQSGVFSISAFFCCHIAARRWQTGQRRIAISLAILALAFLADIAFVFAARTVLFLLPILMLIFAAQTLGLKRGLAMGVVAALLASAAAWTGSSHVRARIESAIKEVKDYEASGINTSAGLRLAWYQQSLGFVARAPLFGHGAGAIRALTEVEVRRSGADSEFITSNPHNQLIATAIQTGILGVLLVIGLWASHVRLFLGREFSALVGLGIVAQNILSSQFNSHLQDFTQGWGYVLGAGIAAGVLLAKRRFVLPDPSARDAA